MINRAWEVGINGRYYAIPIGQSIAILAHIKQLNIPSAITHCNSMIRWQAQLLPVMDIAKIWQANNSIKVTSRHAWLIVGWEETGLGCLTIHSIPRRIQVTKEMACAIPNDEPLAYAAAGCFKDGMRNVVILNCKTLFTSIPM
ncbi:MAG: chemotaxis protein CheW [Mariprofundales bacterium]